MSATGYIPGRARNPPCCFDSTAQDDEFHAVNDGRTPSAAPDERLHERLENVHEDATVGKPRLVWKDGREDGSDKAG